ncbi:TIGR04282 family arsenosugar biosynthesis glycosyltransferase [Gillisia sp. M10.2A]|uniref:TIGR04282 family arsenosugar biosynthesis glycosyltransferase n=1 Tax=Gillisia lutea TaxID=2909668 RepID=A0ABS9EFA2_9FLAO|nr:TIGR04282 family arsenosugar biosynthesis glycosyltransferase [Gillisia lutea]MCF4100839.1 TIGR04282 family arsenosugar biosynthesis glycosyltransferase [Gillisia lutea]
MITTSKELLLIFTRNPELGKVKSRLAKDVGEQTALDIYKFLLAHTLEITKDLNVAKEVHYSEKIFEDDIWNSNIYLKCKQEGRDLGERMQHAFEEGFKNGYEKIIIIGSDMYDMDQTDIENAFKALDDKDFVLGPAEDGGYYLLGMKKLNTKVFQRKEWGTATVLTDTLKNLGLNNTKLLETRNDVDYYSDIKEHEDFQHFFQHITS